MRCIGMNGLRIFACFILVLLMAAAPVAATTTTVSSDSITSVSPASGQKGDTVTVTITGVNFTPTAGSVRLEKSGDSDISGTIVSWGIASITCRFKISSSRDTGKWDVVVVKGYDSTTIVKPSYFAVSEEMSITSVSPTSGRAGNDVTMTITGKGFDDDYINQVYLYNEDYDNITSDYDVKSETKIEAEFELDDDAEEDTYQVCIEDDYGTVECKKNAFEILTNKEGTIEIDSDPSGAAIYIDNVANGTTPRDIDIIVGSYKVILKKTGYQDWSKTVNVQEEETTEIDATLYVAATATPTQTQSTPVPTATPTTSRTTIKSTFKVPTTYADVPTTTTASPVEPVFIIGAVCLALIVLRKR